ncbi:MAG: hypothetical protein U5Q03_00030 [Bacteroidota bacterium]|nr:hypothetical protein [Bacteroidota bacterium]
MNKANKHALAIASEFNRIDNTKSIPVFLRAEDIYKAVMKEGEKLYKPKELYSLQAEIPIPASANLLGRPLVNLFRHGVYSLNKWEGYKEQLNEVLVIDEDNMS